MDGCREDAHPRRVVDEKRGTVTATRVSMPAWTSHHRSFRAMRMASKCFCPRSKWSRMLPTGEGNLGGDGLAERRLRRVTLREAADILGVSKEAVRKRVIRGTLRSETGEDGRRYVYVDVVGDEAPTGERDVLISQLRDEVAYLREENRRKDEIIMQQATTMRALTAPQEPPESSETAAEMPMGPEPSEAREEAQGAAQPRSW